MKSILYHIKSEDIKWLNKAIFIVLYLILNALTFPIQAQDLKKGFEFIDSSEYNLALNFFQDFLKSNPQHPQGSIGYGRALGLGGDSEDAVAYFRQLLKRDTFNLEFKLNYAESLLWNKEFKRASDFYQSLYSPQDKDYRPLYGLVASFASLQEYEKATSYLPILKKLAPAEAIKPLEKNVIIGRINQGKEAGQVVRPLALLDTLLSNFSVDRNVHLTAAYLYLYMGELDASENHFLLLDSIDRYESSIGLGHVYTEQKRYDKLESLADTALATRPIDTIIDLRAEIAKMYALALNENIDNALILADNVLEKFPNNVEIQLTKARIMLWDDQYNESKTLLSQLPEKYFEGQLGKAENARAYQYYFRGITHIDTALAIRPNHLQALKLKNELLPFTKPQLSLHYGRSNDIVDNFGYDRRIDLKLPLNDQWMPIARVGWFSRDDRQPDIQASMRHIRVGTIFRPIYNLRLQADYNLFRYGNDLRSESVGRINFHALYNIKPKISLKFQHETMPLHYNSTLVLSNTTETFNQLTLHTDLVGKPGLYAFYASSNLSDGNGSNNFYVHIFHKLLDKRALKVGASIQNIGFNENAEIYFAPLKYQHLEANLELNNYEHPGKSMYYRALIGLGSQQIEEFENQSTMRIETQLDLIWTSRIKTIFGFQYNNASIVSSAGFERYYAFGEIHLSF